MLTDVQTIDTYSRLDPLARCLTNHCSLEGGAKRAQRASSNVFSMFEQTQIQEFKEAFTLIDQNRDGFIDQEDLKDTYASLGKLNVKDGELEEMLKEASGPINFTMFLNLFGEKLHGSEHQPAERVLNVHGKNIRSSGFCCSSPEVKQMFESSNIDAAGNLDYKSLCYIITHGEEQQDLLQADQDQDQDQNQIHSVESKV
uniref:Myosin light chain 5 n=1 Tax=Amphiprion percula TaxID=161767 RepID=A0A3P8UDI4_AMPPE